MDASQIFTGALGKGLGMKVRAGPMGTGLGFAIESHVYTNGKYYRSKGMFKGPIFAWGHIIVLGSEEVDGKLMAQTAFGMWDLSWIMGELSRPVPWTEYAHFDVGIGVGYSCRVGFNLLQFIDFVGGLVCLDILLDDPYIERETPFDSFSRDVDPFGLLEAHKELK